MALRTPLSPLAVAAAISVSALTASTVAVAGPVRTDDTARYLITFQPGASVAVQQALSRVNGRDVKLLPSVPVLGVTLPKAAVAVLKRHPQVRAVEPNVQRHLMASKGWKQSTGKPYALGQKVPFGIPMVQADKVSDQFANNRKVCIIDSGYDLAHPDLQKTNVTGWTNGDAAYVTWDTDQNSHGTHVAGTIAALNNSRTGVVGVMPSGNIQLHIAKVFDGSGSTGTETILEAVLECSQAGAHVANMSLGGAINLLAEEVVYQFVHQMGMLVIAAAGNDGNTTQSYPAGYSTVVSVGAVDENSRRASFSQFNAEVELAGPGENVLSTVPFEFGREAVTLVDNKGVDSNGMEGSPLGQASGALVDLGFAQPSDPAVDAAGKICLIERGKVTFAEKIQKCEANGGVGAVVFNNGPGGFGGTLGGVVTAIPSVSIAREDGLAFRQSALGKTASVALKNANYAFFNGTSMATPHVAAVAALVWSHAPECSNDQVRAVLQTTAKDLGAKGRDPSYGFGLVQAQAAVDKIKVNCGQ